MTRQVIVCGLPRGGTSCVSGVLRELGVFMGRRIDPMTHEDLDFFKALDYENSKPHLQRLISSRDQDCGVWGVKAIGSKVDLAGLNNLLSNPFFIVVLRNPVAILNSHVKHANKRHGAIKASQVLAKMRDLAAFVEGSGVRHWLVSYEQIITRPDQFVRELVSCTGIAPEPQQIEHAVRFIQPGSYRKTSFDLTMESL